MEADGYVTRTRDPQNRRAHRVELTELGEQAFQRLLTVVIAFDQQLREGFSEREITRLGSVLTRLRGNVDVGVGVPTAEVTS